MKIVRPLLVVWVMACVAAARTQAAPPAASQPAGTPAGEVKVAAIQFSSVLGDAAANRKGLEPLIRQAARAGAKVVILPETAITGYMSTDLKTTWALPGWPLTPALQGLHPRKYAEPVPGPSTEAFARLAGELGIYLTIPLLESDPKSGRFFNTIVLAGPDGKCLLHYRKLNPWPFAEQSWATPGDRGHQYVDTPFGRLALLICYDINFEPPRLKKAKVDTLLYCIAWVDTAGSDWFEKRLPAIARDNDLNIIGANWTLPAGSAVPDWHGYGKSRIISRQGRILARPKGDIGNDILYATLR